VEIAAAESAGRIADSELQRLLGGALDRERKIDRAVASLVGFPKRKVVVVDRIGSERAERLREAGADVTLVQSLDAAGLRASSADAIVGFWNILAARSPRFEEELRVIERALARGGTAVAVHDYGRDDASLLLADESRRQELVAWSNRRGPFLGRGFKIHVLHCWWQFESIDRAREVLASAFGPPGDALASTLRQPRVSHKVAIYHRTFPAP
jgi:hypothetical protein